MSFQAQFTRLQQFLLSLECLDAAGQAEAFANEARETGGTLIPPSDNTGASHLFEIQLHDTFGSGSSEEEAVRNWKMAAKRSLAPLTVPQEAITVDDDDTRAHRALCGDLF
ncbi:hypothetical protein [Shimia sagamensis]|uniref:Uncharacterized protein n=1 Tax=Shimia sagamensis TaxID=1566352 RepID=A0ABY1PDL3_9RHOB|nr:hypothetical protein [Shimia sagamensis]SMP32017.1 hypothetical protein SAMN06265373_108116 [Shimia sagamensis]